MDHYTIHVHTGVGWCDYSIVAHQMEPDAPMRTLGRSSGFLQLPGGCESPSLVLTHLAEELFNAASAPPWDV
jgi:hypothetical protein